MYDVAEDHLLTSGFLTSPWIDGKQRLRFSAESVNKALENVPSSMRGKRGYQFQVFRMFWAMRNDGGISVEKKGSFTASDPRRGRLVKRVCSGLYRCPNWNRSPKPCVYTKRPLSKKAKNDEKFSQEHMYCTQPKCRGALMEHVECSVKQKIIMYADGAIFMATGKHKHQKPTTTGMTPVQTADAKRVIELNPTLGPTALRSGGPDLVGPFPNLRSISTALGNKGRISHLIKQMKRESSKGIGPMEQTVNYWKELDDKYPNVRLGPKPFIMNIQSDFMANLPCREGIDGSRFTNGLVTDAAMSYFKFKGLIVIVTSAFSEELYRWAPVFITVTDGQSAANYEGHFFPLMVSIYKKCCELGIPFEDVLLLMVCVTLLTRNPAFSCMM